MDVSVSPSPSDIRSLMNSNLLEKEKFSLRKKLGGGGKNEEQQIYLFSRVLWSLKVTYIDLGCIYYFGQSSG